MPPYAKIPIPLGMESIRYRMENTSVNSSSTEEKNVKSQARSQLDPKQWVEAATEMLCKDGINGLRVETLAKKFGVTKGSFYWHFKDRQALLDAVLERWKTGRIQDIEKVTQVPAGEEKSQLFKIIELYGTSKNRKGMAIELAIRDWARHDTQASETVVSVDAYRLACTKKLFVANGLSDEEAQSQSLLLYACVFGLSLMQSQNFDGQEQAIRTRIARQIVSPQG